MQTTFIPYLGFKQDSNRHTFSYATTSAMLLSPSIRQLETLFRNRVNISTTQRSSTLPDYALPTTNSLKYNVVCMEFAKYRKGNAFVFPYYASSIRATETVKVLLKITKNSLKTLQTIDSPLPKCEFFPKFGILSQPLQQQPLKGKP